MAAPPDPDDTWVQLVLARYSDDAPGPACLHCNPDPIRTEEGESEDARTSTTPPNTTGSPNIRRKRKEKERTGKECKHFFCVPCKQGGLCVNDFRPDGRRPHFEHPRLQIFRTSYEYSVRKEDIAPYLDTTTVLGICSNDRTVHYLTTRKPSTALSNVMYCHGCRQKVANAKSYPYREENAKNAKVCSIQCLLVVRARNRPVNYRNGHERKQRMPMQSPLE